MACKERQGMCRLGDYVGLREFCSTEDCVSEAKHKDEDIMSWKSWCDECWKPIKETYDRRRNISECSYFITHGTHETFREICFGSPGYIIRCKWCYSSDSSMDKDSTIDMLRIQLARSREKEKKVTTK